jgi:hypothetical protein
MLSTVPIVFLVLWMLGLATSYTRMINGQHPVRG